MTFMRDAWSNLLMLFSLVKQIKKPRAQLHFYDHLHVNRLNQVSILHVVERPLHKKQSLTDGFFCQLENVVILMGRQKFSQYFKAFHQVLYRYNIFFTYNIHKFINEYSHVKKVVILKTLH